MENSTEMENRGGGGGGGGGGALKGRGGRGTALRGDRVKKGMRAREKTDKDKACAMS